MGQTIREVLVSGANARTILVAESLDQSNPLSIEVAAQRAVIISYGHFLASNPVGKEIFETRPELVNWLAIHNPTTGQKLSAAGFDYLYDGVSNVIIDLPGCTPFGEWNVEHFIENSNPGVTDIGPTLVPPLALGFRIKFNSQIYATSITLEADDALMEGNDRTSTTIYGLASLGNNPVIRVLGSGEIALLKVDRDEATPGLSTAAEGDFIGVDIQYAVKGVEVVNRCLIANCGTGIWGFAEPPAQRPFNWAIRDVEIIRHRYLAIDVQGGTGLILDNIYIEGQKVQLTHGAIRVRDSNTVQLRLVNCHQTIHDTAGLVQLHGIDSISLKGTHVENCKPTGDGAVIFDFDRANVIFEDLQIQHCPFDGSNQGLYRLGNAGKDVSSGNTSFSKQVSTIDFGNIMYQGLNHPSASQFPGWVNGLYNLSGWNVFSRTVGATGDYVVNYPEFVPYLIFGLDDSALERNLYQEFKVPGITFTGQYSRAPNPNLLTNGKFDKYVQTQASISGPDTQEIAAGWYISQETGVMSATRILTEANNAQKSLIRVTVDTAGTYQKFFAVLKHPQTYADGNCFLSIRAKAPIGTFLDKISLQINTGVAGSPSTAYLLLLNGTDATLQGTGADEIYSIPFVMPGSGITWDADAYAQVNIFFNTTTPGITTTVDFKWIKLEEGQFRTTALNEPVISPLFGPDVYGYAEGIGAGGYVVQQTSRTTAVTLHAVSGTIELFPEAGTSALKAFHVINSECREHHVIEHSQRKGLNTYSLIFRVEDFGFWVTIKSESGTFVEAVKINFGLKTIANS